tara:strand:+ start:84 stop:821 length:738 start_codon:yes stop_codon:yes gene_type:complete
MNAFRKIQFKLIQRLLEINEFLIFEKRTNKVLKTILTDKVKIVFDVGANKGQSINLFKKWFPGSRIYSFEPNPKLFSKIKKKHGKNKKIKLFQIALSDKKGRKIFNENLFDSSSTLENVNKNSKYLRKKAKLLGVKPKDLIVNSYPVDVQKLSTIIKDLKLSVIDFVKIDVEGHELNCLQGLFDGLKAKIKCIQIENNSNDLYRTKNNLDEIIDLLKKNGFNRSKEIKHGFGRFSDIIFWTTDND